MNQFVPYGTSIEVEPMNAEGSVILNDAPKFVECAKIVSVPASLASASNTNLVPPAVGDILFFRAHGFFELPVFQGKKRYVVKYNDEIVLGILKNVAA